MSAIRKPNRVTEALIAGACVILAGLAQSAIRDVHYGETELVELPSDYLGVSLDPRIIQRLLGIRLLMADLVWVDTLIKSDMRHEKSALTPIYHAFKTVVTLDPDNVMAYYIAGMYLSVVKDDIQGATAILRMGVDYQETHPDAKLESWRLPWTLGYNLMVEENDIEGGSIWVRKAAAMPGAPPVIRTLAAHVSTESGRLEIAERVLNDAYKHATRPEERKRIEVKMLDLGARHDLAELNERFQDFLKATKSTSFSRRHQFDIFMRSIGHTGHDLLGRRLRINDTGRIEPQE